MIWSSSRPAVHAAATLPAPQRWTPAEIAPFILVPAGGEADAAPTAEVARAMEVDAEEARVRAEAAAERERAENQAAELAHAVREAYQRGFEEGRVEGERGEEARLRTPVRAATQAVEELRAGEARWQGNIEENVCALAVAVARQVIGREVSTDPSAVTDLVRRALAEFPVDHPVRVRVNPRDLESISSAAADGAPDVAAGWDAAWHADPLIEPGGCVVEGRERIIDGRVDTALERIYRRLTYLDA